jgi:phage shock protein E
MMGLLSQIFNRSDINQVEPAQVQEMLAGSQRPFLLDVRTPEEYKQGHIRGAELIPLNELSAKKGRIPKDREVVCVCATGSRSSTATRQLSALGYKVSNLHGGMNRWTRFGLPIKLGMAK